MPLLRQPPVSGPYAINLPWHGDGVNVVKLGAGDVHHAEGDGDDCDKAHKKVKESSVKHRPQYITAPAAHPTTARRQSRFWKFAHQDEWCRQLFRLEHHCC